MKAANKASKQNDLLIPSSYEYSLRYSKRRTSTRLQKYFTDLNVYCIKGALALVVLVSFSGLLSYRIV